MGLKAYFWLFLVVAARVSVAKKLGYFDDISVCADPEGLTTCFDSAETNHTNCIDDNCPRSKSCAKSCNGDVLCTIGCPDIDCTETCGAERAGSQIDCIASSCWNQVYSCEYQKTVEDFVALYHKDHLDGIPFWPPPDNAPGGCSCNIGRAYKKELLIYDHLPACHNNLTNLDKIGYDTDDSISYVEACNCCAESAIRSTIYDTCPNTKPSVIEADYWFNRVLQESEWIMCRLHLDDYDCAGDLGYGAEDAGGTQKFYNPGEFPKNGTETLHNINGVVSTPVSGASFTWTYISDVHIVTVRSTDHIVTATATDIGTSSIETATSSVDTETSIAETGASSADTGAGSAATGMGVVVSVPFWGLLTPLGALGISLIWRLG